jgi:hypothetical protein
VVRACAELGVPIVPQGGNTGQCGGATPDERGNAIVLSLSRMNRVRAIDYRQRDVDRRSRRAARAGAGGRGRRRAHVPALACRGREVARSAATCRPTPAATPCCGSAIPRDLVLGIEVVLATAGSGTACAACARTTRVTT